MTLLCQAKTCLEALVRRQSVDSLNGGFFTRGFSAVGRSGKKKEKKEPLVTNIPKITLEL